MALTIESLTREVDESKNGFNSQSFRNSLESMMEYIKGHNTTSVAVMEDVENVRYKGDLAGWLLSKSVPENYHWLTARMNGLTCCSEYAGITKSFLIPQKSLVDTLLQKHKSKL